MEKPIQYGGAVIASSFAIAYILTMIPFSEEYIYLKPEWVSLVLIFWCIHLPHRIGVVTGWSVGLLMDVIMGVLLGQYALTMAVIAYTSYKLRNRLRIYPHLQQTFIIMLLVGISLMIILWIKGIQHESPDTLMYWAPALTSAIVWPFLSVVLNKVRLVYGIV